MTTVEMDMAKVEEFGGKMAGILNSAAAALMLSVGHRLGLFDVMAGLAPSTSHEVAAAAGMNERYVREWLGAMTVAGIVEYDAGRDTYRLPPEHAALTTRAAGPNNFAAFMQFIPVVAEVETELLDKFRQGGGVPYSSYTRFHEAMAEISGAVFDAALVPAVLPMVPGIIERLEAGIDVADIGTGSGHAVNVMAQAFPKSRIVGIDFSDQALERGRAEAASLGLSNASFLAKDAATLDSSTPFDFITTFDAVHDQAKPQAMIDGIFAALKPGGYWLCVDIQASSHVGENVAHPLGTFGYTVSCMHCMTVSLAYDGEGLGAMWGVQKARSMFAQAGFTDIQVHALEGDPMNNYYVCRKPD
jgi:ubiquinone/menaquinone biosynthesis C-methylase UbiE